MPTATEFFGITAWNLGPLTTTYTAPSSCATSIKHPVFVNAASPYSALAFPSCTWMPYGECLPNHKEWESGDQQTSSFFQQTSVYFSPGIACPAGWETVGLLAHLESGKFSASGVLTTPAPTYDGFPQGVYPTDFWKNMLDESETVAYCCPRCSGYEGNQYGYAECLSKLGPVSSYTYSEHCMVYGRGGEITVISSVDGLAYSDGVLSRMEPTRVSDYRLTTLNLGVVVGETRNGFSDIALATWVPAIPLVYKKSDMAKAKGENGESGSGTGTATAEGGGENAASTIPRQGLVVVLGLLLGILAGTSIFFS
ncbi:hypothetical protein FAUST_7171 [Fusarium austroamericanum]|uniref:Uncharacterized protein n=1 Tax=Fusarium austroamericanum TaxID=282268 RepID=A0AAN6BYQ8_FUSAU|nr:hypothetical protein FAUST_7171 [Fusarium austroamericanum]